MAAMLIVHIAIAVMMAMLAMIMIVVMVVVMIVAQIMMVVMLCGRDGERRTRPARLQRAHEIAALGPDQADTERGDQSVARDLDRALGAAHGFGRRVQQPSP